MIYRTRIKYTAEQKAEMRDRWLQPAFISFRPEPELPGDQPQRN